MLMPGTGDARLGAPSPLPALLGTRDDADACVCTSGLGVSCGVVAAAGAGAVGLASRADACAESRRGGVAGAAGAGALPAGFVLTAPGARGESTDSCASSTTGNECVRDRPLPWLAPPSLFSASNWAVLTCVAENDTPCGSTSTGGMCTDMRRKLTRSRACFSLAAWSCLHRRNAASLTAVWHWISRGPTNGSVSTRCLR